MPQLLERSPFSSRVAEPNLHHIFYTHYEDYEKTKPVWTNVNFVAVQRMVIHCLQKRVMEVALEVNVEKDMNEDRARRAGRVLHELCELMAIRSSVPQRKLCDLTLARGACYPRRRQRN